uniref:NADH dehydrogenase subunit 6 n=1 Tax=Acrobeloides nanus TaxID=290746 RepID=A0A914C4K2_9BILA
MARDGKLHVMIFVLLVSMSFTPCASTLAGGWDKQTWERAVIVLMLAALLFEIVIFFTFLATFCKSFQAFIPLSFLAFIATILLLISIILYGAKSNSKIAYIPAASGELNANHDLGYSYWLAVTSTIIMAIATVFGIVLSAIPSRRPPLLITN